MDDLMPNDGDQMGGDYYPDSTTKIETSPLKDRSSIQEDVDKWFEKEIESCGSIDNIQIDVITVQGTKYDRQTSVEAQLLAFTLLKQKLQAKKQEFEEWLKKNG